MNIWERDWLQRSNELRHDFVIIRPLEQVAARRHDEDINCIYTIVFSEA
jgi:hypothetical protein